MASNSQTRRLAHLGKRLISHSTRLNSPAAPTQLHPASPAAWRDIHISAYDKNPDDQVCAAVVPDHVIQPQSDKYWAPHPHTGVFGPATDATSGGGSLAWNGGDAGGSALELKARFRHLENLEKPLPEEA